KCRRSSSASPDKSCPDAPAPASVGNEKVSDLNGIKIGRKLARRLGLGAIAQRRASCQIVGGFTTHRQEATDGHDYHGSARADQERTGAGVGAGDAHGTLPRGRAPMAR